MDLSLKRLKIIQTTGLGALVLFCSALLVFLQQTRLQAIKSSDSLTPESVALAAEAEKTSLEIWKTLPAYGYENLLSNWVFLRFLQYFGDDDARNLGNYQMSADFFDIIVERDPFFTEGYYYLSGSSSLFAGTPERTVEILDKGLAEMEPLLPGDAHYVWRMKAIDEHLFLADMEKAINSYLTAAKWASYHSDPESIGAMQRSQATAAFLVRDPRSIQARVVAWTTVLGQSRDTVTWERALGELEKMGVEVTVSDEGVISYKVPREILEAEKEALQIEEDVE